MVRTNDPEVVWDKPNEVEDKWIQFIDENVLRSVLSSCTYGTAICLLWFLELPKGSKPLGIDRCGSSYWTKGAEIVTEQSDGSNLSFFLKA